MKNKNIENLKKAQDAKMELEEQIKKALPILKKLEVCVNNYNQAVSREFNFETDEELTDFFTMGEVKLGNDFSDNDHAFHQGLHSVISTIERHVDRGE